MPFITGLDTETTGLDQADGHRIIEVALLTYDLASRTLVDKFIQRIDPERSIQPKAQEVHGITYAELVGQPKWDHVAPEVAHRMNKSDVCVAHNMAFDGPFIGMELARVGIAIPTCGLFCTMENGRWSTFDGKNPKLSELCFALGVPYDQSLAHGAGYDTEVMMACLWRGIDRGFYRLPL